MPQTDRGAEASNLAPSATKHRSPFRFLLTIPKVIGLLLLSVVLFVYGLVGGIYNETFQDELSKRLVERLNTDPDMHVELGKLRLKFPLNVNVTNVLFVNHGDTLVEAANIEANVKLRPLFSGNVAVERIRLQEARYQMGALDSATCMVIKGRDIDVGESNVALADMRIDVSRINLDSAQVNLFINPADTFPVTPPSEPSPLSIHVARVDYNDLKFTMQLMPTIYDLSAEIATGNIDNVNVDVMKQTVEIGDFKGNRLDATYLMPDEKQLAATTVIVNEAKKEEQSLPWTIRIGNIDMTDSKALYTTFGMKPEPGMDFGYIQFDDVNLSVTDFYNRAASISLPFDVHAVERCGLNFDASGTLGIDSVGMTFRDFALKTTTGTNMNVSGYMGTTTELTDPLTPLRLSTSGNISIADVQTMFPAFKPYLAGFRKGARIENRIEIGGTSGNLDIANLNLKVDRHISLAARGNVRNAFADKGLAGNISFNGAVSDISYWTADLLAGTGVVIPSLTLKGKASFDNDKYSANLACHTGRGDLVLDGAFNGNYENYHLDLTTRQFPVNAFMPKLGVGNITAHIKADGHGFDLFKTSTRTDVSVDISDVRYLDRQFSNIGLRANIGDDCANVVLNSYNPGLDLHLDAKGQIIDNKYDWQIALASQDLNLEDLGLSDTPATVSANLELKADINKNLRDMDAVLTLHSADYSTPESNIGISDAKIILTTTDSLTNIIAQNRDLYAFFSTSMSVDSIARRLDYVSQVIDSQVKHKSISIPELQKSIMPFSLDIEAGNDNALADMLAEKDIHYKNLSVLAGNDTSIYMEAKALDFSMNDIKLDTIDFNLRQFGERLDYVGNVNNRPGTFDEWAHVNIDGFLSVNKIGVNLHQQNIKNETGFDLGATLDLKRDSTMTLHIEPYFPTINYKKWTVNPENFITYDLRHKHLDANLRLKSDVSQIALYTEHANDTIKALHGSDEDLILQLFDIHLQDWIALDPFAPPIKGNLSAGIRLNWEDNVLNGKGTIDLTDFTYGKEKVGDFNVDVALFTDASGLIKTDAEVWVNGEKTMALSGALNDSEAETPFNMDFKMFHLPLSVANPFLPGIARLGGTLNGEMDIRGDSDNPQLNGFLSFSDATVNVNMLGATFTMNNDTIPVRDNKVRFDNFTIDGANENPLRIDGTVDIARISDPQIALNLKADNMQIVNTNRAPKGADIYGKAFIGLNASARGDLRVLNVKADVDVLPGTNVTYILAGGAAALESQSAGEMVKFVNFADTAAVAAADSLKIEGTIMNLTANLNIRPGSIINVDLGTNAQDRVQIQGNGSFTYVSSPVGDGRLTGRYTFSGGFIKYAPPLISNLNFAFSEGSYVAFTGELMNPSFNIKAVEQMRANVSQAGQNSRLIYFDIILTVTGNLNSPKIAFGLETDDDVTVANELASMSPTQRESEAMNLLLYNTYTGGSTKATSNLNGNPLFSFLTNSVNSWLANNVRGVDLSIGVNQYDQTTNGSTSTTTSYSYQVSKTLFNDRFKIVVGGSYSDDPNDDSNVAESLINDISFEYYLNRNRTMYLKLFRHTGYESILEGEITQMGVGFVYKKRISSLIDMFRSVKSKAATRLPSDSDDTNTPKVPSDSSTTSGLNETSVDEAAKNAND